MLRNLKTIKKAPIREKKVLVRADLNLPIVHGKITDLARLKRIIPTLNYLLENKSKVILISHYGQPKGKFVLNMSLSPLVDEINKLLPNTNVKFSVNIFGDSTKEKLESLLPGEILLIENIRFHKEEEKNDLEFAKKIASFADIYVNEAFSCSHRKHASITALPKFLPSYAGFLFYEEIENLEKYLMHPKRKLMSITGGAKISQKINLLNNLIEKTDYMVIGGAMANTFLLAQGYNVGKSLCEHDFTDIASSILAKARSLNCEIILPSDIITAKSINNNSSYQVKLPSNVENDDIILDVGPKFLANIILKLDNVQTVLWNGPLGAFEYKPFDIGTITIARAIASTTSNQNIVSVAGGGDVVSAINSSGLNDNFTYVSTGGGAFLEWLESGTMPGIESLLSSCVDNKII